MTPNKELKSESLAQILLIESMVIHLPDKEAVFSFICQGLSEIPGVKSVSYKPIQSDAEEENAQLTLIPLKIDGAQYGALQFELTNAESFDIYAPYLENLCHMVAVVLDQRRQRNVVKERTVELAEALEQAKAASRAKSAFLANMSHEIRTPMNAIIGLTHLMQQASVTQEQTEQLTKIDTSAKHLLSIINDILDISKIEAGKLHLEHSDFHLDDIFDHIQSMFKEQAKSNDVTIEVDRNTVPQWLNGDLTRLRQALLNYVSNAIKFTDNGTIFLRVKKLEEQDDEIRVRFEVEDTGIGIAPNKLPDLFKAFEQADVSTTRKYGGTGLGLDITRRLVQLMDGEVGVESELGRGSTFWFTARLTRGHGTVPAAPTKEATNAEAQLQNLHAGSHILLVEDNLINSEVAVALLSGVGLVVNTAEDGVEAVAMVRKVNYDLILMDVQMPRMDGLEATRLIRSMPYVSGITTDVPILAMTANVFLEDRQACLASGMNDFVAKPFDLDGLFSKIIKWLPKQAGV
jgi:two-component system sensor histidine kinase/response regulator